MRDSSWTVWIDNIKLELVFLGSHAHEEPIRPRHASGLEAETNRPVSRDDEILGDRPVAGQRNFAVRRDGVDLPAIECADSHGKSCLLRGNQDGERQEPIDVHTDRLDNASVTREACLVQFSIIEHELKGLIRNRVLLADRLSGEFFRGEPGQRERGEEREKFSWVHT